MPKRRHSETPTQFLHTFGGDAGEGGFEDGGPVGDDAVHLVLQDVGEQHVVLGLQGGLEFDELLAEIVHEVVGGEFADGEFGEVQVGHREQPGVGLLDLLPGGEDSAELFEGGRGLAFFEEGGDLGVLRGEPLDEGGELAEHGEGELFLVGGGDGDVAAAEGGFAGVGEGGAFDGLAIEFNLDDDLAFTELGLDGVEGVGEGGVGGEVGVEGFFVEENSHENCSACVAEVMQG